MQSGKLDIKPSQTQVREVLSALVSEAKARAPRVDVRLRVSDDVPEVISTDPKRLAQILRHALSNAVKFSYENEVVRLNVGTRRGSDALRPALRFEVVNTGIGLRGRDPASLFEPWEQKQASSRNVDIDMRVGLSICR